MKEKLPLLFDFNLQKKKVLCRVDFDVPLEAKEGRKVADDTRIVISLPTIKYLLKQRCKLILLSHLDRPAGRVVSQLSLKPVAVHLQKLLPKTAVKFSRQVLGEATQKMVSRLSEGEVLLLENLRFRKEEEENDLGFAQNLASLGHFYINEAFANSHRSHASIVGLPKFLPSAAGYELAKEVKILSRLYQKAKKPIIVILGGKKRGKLNFVKDLCSWADYLLIGGLLPKFFSGNSFEGKIFLADLTKEGKDITVESAKRFSQIIKKGRTIVWNGTLGVFEEKERVGTKIVARAVVESSAFKVAGGADTEAALTKLALTEKFAFISSGGGAMLEFLALGDLPGLKALRE